MQMNLNSRILASPLLKSLGFRYDNQKSFKSWTESFLLLDSFLVLIHRVKVLSFLCYQDNNNNNDRLFG